MGSDDKKDGPDDRQDGRDGAWAGTNQGPASDDDGPSTVTSYGKWGRLVQDLSKWCAEEIDAVHLLSHVELANRTTRDFKRARVLYLCLSFR